jgi:hypothetical protein
MDKLHMKPWSWLKGRLPQKHVEYEMECDLVRYENKVETTMGIHSWNLLGENGFRGVQKPS